MWWLGYKNHLKQRLPSSPMLINPASLNVLREYKGDWSVNQWLNQDQNQGDWSVNQEQRSRDQGEGDWEKKAQLQILIDPLHIDNRDKHAGRHGNPIYRSVGEFSGSPVDQFKYQTTMAQCRAAVCPLHWRYCSLALSLWNEVEHIPSGMCHMLEFMCKYWLRYMHNHY